MKEWITWEKGDFSDNSSSRVELVACDTDAYGKLSIIGILFLSTKRIVDRLYVHQAC